MTAKQTDDRTKTDSLQQMTATYKKNRKIILFCSTQEKRKIFQHKLAESTQRLTRASPSSLVFQTHTSTRLRSIVAEHQTFKHLQNLQTHTQKGDTESINRRTKKMPRHHVGAILTFLNVSAVLCFLCSYDLFENQFVFLFECKYNTNNWFKSNISLFYAKKSRKRLRYLLLFMRTQQGNFYSFYQNNAIGFNCLRSRFHCSTK